MTISLPRGLVNGVHTPGSEWERECPLRRARRRQKPQNDVPHTRVAPPGGWPLQTPRKSGSSRTISGRLSTPSTSPALAALLEPPS
jgi:hypothetical protein